MKGRQNVARRRVLTIGVGTFLVAGQALAADLTIVPRLSVEETYTDNVRLGGRRTGQSDFVTNLSPGINIQSRGPRATLSLNYILNYLNFARVNRDQLRQNLIASGIFEVVEDLLTIDAQASISEQFISRAGPISGSIANITTNRRTVQAYNVSPAVKHRFGTFADFEARYGFRYFNADSRRDDQANGIFLSKSTAQSATATLVSGQRFTPFSWQLLFNNDNTKRTRTRTRTNFKSTTARANIEFQINRYLAALASGGWERFLANANAVNPFLPGIDIEGATWDFGARLTPGPRTTMTVRYGRRFNDMVWSAEGRYRMSDRTALTIRYAEDIDTSQRRLGRRLRLVGFDQFGNVIDPFTGLPFDPTDPAFDLTDAAFRVKRFTMTAVGTRKGNTFSLSSYYELRRLPPFPDQEGRGVSFNFSRQLNRRANAGISFNYRKTSGFRFVNGTDKFYGASANVTYQLGERVNARLRYNLADRNSTRARADFVENSVSLSLNATF